MKITIEPETNGEREEREIVVFENVFEFALAGHGYNKLREYSIQQSHVHDKYRLLGIIHEIYKRIE